MTVLVSPQLKPLLNSPKLTLFADELQSYLDDEKRRRDEFYDWITEDIKAEFINGEIVMQTPAKKRHTDASINLTSLLRTFVDEGDLGFVGAETVLITLHRNDYLPDICFFGAGKAAQIEPDQVKYPAPDFIAEVLSPSTESKDRGIKFEEYAFSGVLEQWIVDPEAESVEQYLLRDGAYELLLKIKSGNITSHVIDNFAIPVEAIFDRKIKNRTLVEMLT